MLTILQFVFFFAIFLALTPLLGIYIAKIYSGQRTLMHPVLEWLENLTYRITGVNYYEEMTWDCYLKAFLVFNFFGFLLLFCILCFQKYLPLNPQGFPGVDWDTAFNIAASFVTNTNWQSYTPEITLSYFTQMVGLTVQNFLSASAGMATMLAMVRGIIRKNVNTLGNFWSDIVRSIIYIFLPLSIILSLLLVGQGVIQNLTPYRLVTTLEQQIRILPQGPAASQVAIKQLGTNGGGFFKANSAHPFENPSILSNCFEMFAIILIPAASIYAYGIFLNSKRHAWLLLSVSIFFWLTSVALALYSENQYNPVLEAYPLMEGKEIRFGNFNSLLWIMTTTSVDNGSVNAMISSLTPLAGGMAMLNMMLGGFFGGTGVGLCCLLMFVFLTTFICGMMVGRTPTYKGKKIETNEMKWVLTFALIPGALILMGAGISSVMPSVISSLNNSGPHGLSEILFAFTSVVSNNGSSFAGLNINTPYFNTILGIMMLLGRLAIVVPSLALAGLLAEKQIIPSSSGTFSTNSFLFFILLVGVILFTGCLSFFPALSLGPLVEHLLMLKGQAF